MKKFILLFLCTALAGIFSTVLFSQNQLLTVGNADVMNQTVLLLQNDNQTTIRFDLNQIELFEVETDYGTAFTATTERAPAMLEAGSPDIFYLTTSFIIPDLGSSELEVVYGSYTDFENIEMAPSKGTLSRSIDPQTVPYLKGEVYTQNQFYPETLVSLREPFIMRDVRGQSVDVFPVQYNPITKVLRVYSEITVTVNFTENEGINEFITQKRNKSIDPQFDAMYKGMFINSSVMQSRGYPTLEEGEILVICYDDFMNDMQPYIDWKRTIGRKTTMVSKTEAGGNAQAIKTFITGYYNAAENLAYVLLVGDVAQIPFLGSSNAPSDVEYGILQGGNYLTVLIGRMSCENAAHVQTQVERSIWYERDITIADTWLNAAMGIASAEGAGGGHDSGEADYVHMNNIRTRLMNYGYDPVHQEHNGNTGIPITSTTQISQRINNGVGMINYCNHGDVDAWVLNNGYWTSVIEYTNSHVNQLQNAGKLPFIFSVACVNGKYNSVAPKPVCFAEAWTRATQGGLPTGAVATFMSTVDLNWIQPMTAQDEFNDLVLGIRHTAGGFQYGVDGNRFKTFAGTALNATQRMIMRHGLSSDYKAWTVFGDPALMIRTKTPETMVVDHSPTIPIGESEFTVYCDADDAVAALSYISDENEVIIVGVAVVEDGIATIVFDEPIILPVELTLAVTGFNKVTYLSDPIPVGGELELPEPLNLTFEIENANYVILSWDTPEDRGLTVQGYKVYRDGELITPEPVNNERTFTDIVPQNGEYEYEVTALYGTTLESDFSEPVRVMVNGMCVPMNSDITLTKMEGQSILVSWEAPEYEGLELAGYNVYRDEELINTEIIPATQLNFLDEELEIEIEYCYQVEVVYNDCEETLKTEKECLTILSIHDIQENIYSIFPNPAQNELNITIHDTQSATYNIIISDVYGKKCSHISNLKSQISNLIDISHLSAGIYFVTLYSETNAAVTKRLVIIK